MKFFDKLKNSYKRRKQKAIKRFEDYVLKWVIKSPRRASFYYWFFSKQFDREHYAVIRGKISHLNNSRRTMGADATLRRNVHMIEKGLTTQDLKPVFAEQYIEVTVRIYGELFSDDFDKVTMKWAHDVLMQYFKTVTLTKKIKQAKLNFEKIIDKDSRFMDEEQVYAPYLRETNQDSKINYDEFMKLCIQRRSIRWYEDKEIPLDLVKKALEAGLTAPSACNRQAFRFIIVQDPEKLSHTKRLPMGTDTFAHNIKLMVIIVGDLSAYFDERDRHLIYIDGGLASMNIMMALETLGLASCPINWPDIDEREMKIAEEYELKAHERCVMLMSIGYPLPKGGIPFSAKKGVEKTITIY